MRAGAAPDGTEWPTCVFYRAAENLEIAFFTPQGGVPRGVRTCVYLRL